MDYNLFLVLTTIYQERSVGRAADKLFLSQPAVSHALNRLRDKLQDPLFIRQGRKMVPTEYCELIIPQVDAGLATLDGTLLKQQSFDASKVKRTFKIGCRDILEALFFPELIASIQMKAPGVRIRSISMEPKFLPDALQNGELDIALDSLFAAPEHICNTKLGNNGFVLLCRNGHPIVKNCNLDSYLSFPHVVAALKDSDINLIDNALTAQNLSRNVVLRCENFYGAIQAICQSDLIMTTPESAAIQFAAHLPLSILPVPIELPDISMHLYWWKMAESDPATMWLRDSLQAIAHGFFVDG
jgi:DNA-binding transcriptional LysR family regulator